MYFHILLIYLKKIISYQARRSKNESGGAEPYIPYIYSIYSSNDRKKKSLFSKKSGGAEANIDTV